MTYGNNDAPTRDLTELEYCRLMLDNHIAGLEISKSTGYWSNEEERLLDLMRRIKSILERIEEK